MQVTVGTTAVKIPAPGRARPIIQNLGPGTIYLDTLKTVASSTGLVLSVGTIYEFPVSGGHSDIWVISDAANTDVRVVGVG
jgi:hypothetical protein